MFDFFQCALQPACALVEHNTIQITPKTVSTAHTKCDTFTHKQVSNQTAYSSRAHECTWICKKDSQLPATVWISFKICVAFYIFVGKYLFITHAVSLCLCATLSRLIIHCIQLQWFGNYFVSVLALCVYIFVFTSTLCLIGIHSDGCIFAPFQIVVASLW